jgi:hypothetical protein
MKTYVHYISYLAEFFLQFSIIQELERRSKQHILFHITYFGTTKYFLFDKFFHENRAVYEIMWINMVQPDRPQVTIQCTCFAFWITNGRIFNIYYLSK